MRLYLMIYLIFPLLYAGGWDNTLIGIRALSMGAAFTGVADDASCVFYNPAGLAYSTGWRFEPGIFYTMPHHIYKYNDNVFHSRRNSFIPQFFLTTKRGEIGIGFGFSTPYGGGGIRWDDVLNKKLDAALGVNTFTLAFGYGLSEKFSFGVGFDLYFAINMATLKNLKTGEEIEIKETGSNVSGRAGILFNPSQKMRIGFSIRTPLTMRIEGQMIFRNQVFIKDGTFNSEREFSLPLNLSIGASFRPFENSIVAAEVEYVGWSVLDSIKERIDDFPQEGKSYEGSTYIGFEDILKVKIGGELSVSSRLNLRFGLAFDPAAARDDALDITNIDVDKIAFLGGFGYKIGFTDVDVAIVYTLGEERIRTTFLGEEKFYLDALVVGAGLTIKF